MSERTISIDQIFSVQELADALRIWKRNTTPAKEICEKIVKPNMARVNTKLGQENDPTYLAYMVEYVFDRVEKR